MDEHETTVARLVPTTAELERRLRSPLDRLLLVFSDVRPGEGTTALAMLASVFFLLAATYFLKPARDGLLSISGVRGLSDMELKAYSSFAQSVLLLGVVPIYCWFAKRFSRRRLVTSVTLFFVGNLAFFWCLQPGVLVERMPFLGLVFYLWFGIYNLLVIVQFWSFAADFYNDEDGRRLFPAIAFGATAGAAAGAWMAQALVRAGIATTYTLLLFGAAALLASLGLMRFADGRDPAAPAVEAGARQPKGWSNRGALRLVAANRYLLAIAFVVLFANWVKTNSDNLLFSVVQEVVQREATARGLTDPVLLDRFRSDQTTAFYGDFFFWVNAVALLLQALVASRVLKYGGLGVLLLALPALSIIAYPVLALFPMLMLFRLTKIGEDAAAYSLHNTANQVLWLPTTHEMKYKGKAAVDTLFVRFGDGLAAATTFVGVQLFLLPVKDFFAFNSILVAGWLVAAVIVVREHRRLAANATRRAVSTPAGGRTAPASARIATEQASC